MGLFHNIKKKGEQNAYSDTDVVALGNGVFCPPEEIADPVFSGEVLGQTVAFKLDDGVVVSPVNGTIEMIYPTGHAFGVKMKDQTGLLIHIGIDTVNMDGNGFKTLVKEGDIVKAGQPVVKVNLDAVRSAGYDPITMLIVAEPVQEEKMQFTEYGNVRQGQQIRK